MLTVQSDPRQPWATASPSCWPTWSGPLGRDRRTLLRGPRGRLDDHGAVLRQGAQGTRPPVGVDEEHLREPDARAPLGGPVGRSARARGPTDRAERGAAVPVERPPFRASTAAYWTCGLLQLVVFLGYAWATVLFTVWVGEWVMAADGVAATYGRGVLAAGLALGLACAIPILAKWVLVGRWRETEIRVWSLAYFRLWTVKSLLRISPIPFTAGTPIYNVFLRALGADVGRGALIVSRRMPLVTDLLTVGPGAVVRRNVLFNGYHAEAGRIRTGRVTIGAGAQVGEAAVLGLDVTIGDGAWLGHASSLQDGEQVPAGERRDGFGGQHFDATDDAEVERWPPGPCGRPCSPSPSSAQRSSSTSRWRPPSPSGCRSSTTHAPECSPDRWQRRRPTPRRSRSAR